MICKNYLDSNKKNKLFYKKLNAWLSDELYIGAGKYLSINIFDQNRIHCNFGLKFNNKINVELGYLNQFLQQGRLIYSTSIMQRNSGLTISSTINF